MTTNQLRKQMQQQIEKLPENVLREVADFMAFILARRRYEDEITDWVEETWQQMAVEQFFRESDDVEYTIDDAIEVYETRGCHPHRISENRFFPRGNSDQPWCLL